MNQFKNTTNETKEFNQMDTDARLEAIRQPLWINYPKAVKLIELIHKYMNFPKKARMQSLLIIGDSNMGKTNIIEKFVSMNPSSTYIDEENVQHVNTPIIAAIASASADEKSLYVAILQEFFTSFRSTDSTVKLRYQVLSLMRECNVQILIIDEIHHLLETTMTKQRVVMNAIKNLSTELRIPIVGFGLETAARVLSNDPQHSSRFDVVKLPKWELNGDFLGVLKIFEEKLPLHKKSKLYSKEKAPLLYQISEGNLGNLHRLLQECAEYAITHEVEEITVEIIKNHKWVRPTNKNSPMVIPL